jgi:hypothetical protein
MNANERRFKVLLLIYFNSFIIIFYVDPPLATTHLNINPISQPIPAGIIEKRLPPPLTTRLGEADREGHPGRLKVRVGGRRTKE